MSGYSWISVISLSCYLFLFFTFLAAKKTKRVMYTFMFLLFIMILWNGGSFCMRMQLWSAVHLWHHISLLGMMMLPVGYFHFVLDFLEDKRSHDRNFWLVFYLMLFAINLASNFFVPLPEVVTTPYGTQFFYHYGWHIYLLFGCIVLTMAHLATIIRRNCKGNRIVFQQLIPVIAGIVFLMLGHIASTLPAFGGLPVDMISGVVNALFLFYALYKKKLFRMTVLLSKTSYSVLALLLGGLLFFSFAFKFQQFLITQLGLQYSHSLVIISVAMILLIAFLYLIINISFDAIFIPTEQQKNETVARFSDQITNVLSVDDILQSFSDAITDTIPLDRLCICIRDADGEFRIKHTTNPLEKTNLCLHRDHPLVSYFKTNHNAVLLREFSRTTAYRSMWEKEKELFRSMDLECFVPLMSQNELIALAMLAKKKDSSAYQPDDIQFLQSIATICAIALKNAYSYEKALEDARRDELTGLFNRRYFLELLEKKFEQHRGTSFSLCLISIDDFKLYNQLYGTQEGNLALQSVAGVLAASITEDGAAARIEGKEFALLLPGYDIYSAKSLAENVAKQIGDINSHRSTAESFCSLTVSIGICAAPYMASTAAELYKNADTAVYAAKRSGKNAVLMYSEETYHREISNTKHKSGYNEHARTIYALTAAIDTKDHYTFQHSQNVAYYAGELAKAAGMEPDLVEIIKEAGLLHDIGKIGIREDILNKPGKLTSEEYDIMKSHVVSAVNIIRYLPSLDYAIPAVLSHHERYDGRGYPRRLAGENIPIAGRILCVADAFDAMTSVRSYKPALPTEEALERLQQDAGTQFDPKLVMIFCELVKSGKLELRAHLDGTVIEPYSCVTQC